MPGLSRQAGIDPLDLERLAVRIERLQQTHTHGWSGGDELEFKRALPPHGPTTLEVRPWQLPDPKRLRELATRVRGGVASPDEVQHASRTYRDAIQVALRLEGLVRDNDPRNPKRMIRDMARGKFPGRWATLVGRVADRHMEAVATPDETSEEEGVAFWKPPARSLFSMAARQKLVRAFGIRAMPFFDFYDAVRATAGGAPVPEGGFVSEFRLASRLIARLLTREPTRSLLADVVSRIRPPLARIDAGRGTRLAFLQVAEMLSALLPTVAADREVHLAMMSSGAPGWVAFRQMNPREEKLDDLQRHDPAMFETVQKSRDVVRQLDRKIEEEVTGGGMVHSRKEILGRPVSVGTDPVSGDEYVFDVDGEMLTVPAYIQKRRKELDARKGQQRVFPDLDELRTLTEEEIAAFTTGEVEYVALTDDKAKAHALTRIYPTKTTVDGDQVVVSGRYKGFLLDDLVNRSGRMVEGVAYDLDPKSGLPVPMETKNPDGTLNVRSNREPYVTTTAKGLLYIRIPGSRPYTAVRNAVADLAKLIPSLRYEEGSRKSAFTFEPKDFSAVREALGGLALSTAAMRLLRDFFAQLAKHELATAAENLKFFGTEQIGGFKPGRQLYVKQKEGMAWLESRGHSGVVALDTGVGKTSLAIASMQKVLRDGLLEEGQKFLYVCTTSLRGNLPKEIQGFIEDPKALLDRVDILTYAEFTKRVAADPDFAARYAAVFFDEAQALKNPTSGPAAAAMRLNHKKKILLTASPMEKSPMEAFVLVSISDNKDLNTQEGRAESRAFRKRFCEEVGGKIVGIKNDPLTQRDFRVWLKQHLYFADKRDVEEVALPQLRVSTVTVEMQPEVEALYRDAAKGIERVLHGMVAKYRDRDPDADDPAIEAARVKLAKEFKALFDLVQFPERVVPGAKNPKVEQAVAIIDERVSAGRRTLVFTDSPDLARVSAGELSVRFPAHLHAECLAGTIRVWQSGEVVQTYGPRAYVDGDRTWAKRDWKTFVLDRVISPRPDFLTCTLTSTYAVGQNLQAFDTVIHLDRDAWNNETMKQRTARAWRNGQTHSVDEVILDAVYADPKGDKDETLDQIVGHLQQLESDLFDQVIIASQTEALGKEWFDMKRLHSSFVELNRRVLELMASPYARRVGLGVQRPTAAP